MTEPARKPLIVPAGQGRAYALILGGKPHDFGNRGEAKVGFISLNAPGGFEAKMAGIAPAMAAADLSLPGDNPCPSASRQPLRQAGGDPKPRRARISPGETQAREQA